MSAKTVHMKPVQGGSSKRKSVTPRHVDDGEADAEDNISDFGVDNSDEDNNDKTNGALVNGQESVVNETNNQSDEDIALDSQGNLADGTIVVHPKEVDDKSDEFKGPECPFTLRQNMQKSVLEEQIIVCTCCGNQINQKTQVFLKRHPVLGVIVCRKCFNYYNSGVFSTDENGMDEYCRWCAEGGKLICCDFCHNAFCKGCVRRNFGRKMITEIMNLDKWNCFVCNPAPLEELRVVCNLIMTKKKENTKKKSLHSPFRGPKLVKDSTRYGLSDESLKETVVGECVLQTSSVMSMLSSKLTSYATKLKMQKNFSNAEFLTMAKKLKQNITITRQNFGVIIKHIADWENEQSQNSGTTLSSDQAKSQASKLKRSGTPQTKSVPKNKTKLEKSSKKTEKRKDDIHSDDLVERLRVVKKRSGPDRSSKADAVNNAEETRKESTPHEGAEIVGNNVEKNDQREENAEQTNDSDKHDQESKLKTDDAEMDEGTTSGFNATNDQNHFSDISSDSEIFKCLSKTEDGNSQHLQNWPITVEANAEISVDVKPKVNRDASDTSTDIENNLKNGAVGEVVKDMLDELSDDHFGTEAGKVVKGMLDELSDDHFSTEAGRDILDEIEHSDADVETGKSPLLREKATLNDTLLFDSDDDDDMTVDYLGGDDDAASLDSDNNNCVPTTGSGIEEHSKDEVENPKDSNQSDNDSCDDNSLQGKAATKKKNRTTTSIVKASEKKENQIQQNLKDKLLIDSDDSESDFHNSKTETSVKRVKEFKDQEDGALCDNEEHSKTARTRKEKFNKGHSDNSDTDVSSSLSDIDETTEKVSKKASDADDLKKSKKFYDHHAKESKDEDCASGDNTEDTKPARKRKEKFNKGHSENSDTDVSSSVSDIDETTEKVSKKASDADNLKKSKKLYDQHAKESKDEDCASGDNTEDTKPARKLKEKSNDGRSRNSDTDASSSLSDFEITIKEDTASKEVSDANDVEKLSDEQVGESKDKEDNASEDNEEDAKTPRNLTENSDANVSSSLSDFEITEKDKVSKQLFDKQGPSKDRKGSTSSDKESNNKESDTAKVAKSGGKESSDDENGNEMAKNELKKALFDDWTSDSDESEIENSQKRKRKITPKKNRPENVRRSSRKIDKKQKKKRKQECTSDVDSLNTSSSDESVPDRNKNRLIISKSDKKLLMKVTVPLQRLDEDILSDGTLVLSESSVQSILKKGTSKKCKSSASESDLDKQINRLCDVKNLKRKSVKRGRRSSNSSDGTASTHSQKRAKKTPAKIKKSAIKASLVTLSSSSDSEQDAPVTDSELHLDISKKSNDKLFSNLKSVLAKKLLLEAEMTKISSNNSGSSSGSDSDFEMKKPKKIKAEKAEENNVDAKDKKAVKKEDGEDDGNGIKKEESEDEKDGNLSEAGDGDDNDENNDENDDDAEDAEEDGEENSPETKKRGKHKLLKVKLSESDSDFEPVKRTKVEKAKKAKEDGNKKGKGRRRVILESDESNVDLSSSGEESDDDGSSASSGHGTRKTRSKKSAEDKKKSKKRRRIKEVNSSSNDSDGDEDKDDDDDNDTTPSGKGRKNIRRVIKDSRLHADTKAAAREEEERRLRVTERQKLYNKVIVGESKDGWTVTRKLVLDKNLETEEDLIEVHEKLIEKLKPHQVEGVRFLWETVCESLERMKQHPGSGCILAHCMGLGKTLQVITFVHTILSNKLTKLTTCLVVCPLNTVLNWENEFGQWLDQNDIGLTVYELTKVKNNWHRADTLKNWHQDGGVMIMGYDMFRNLVQEKGKRINKRQREIFQRTLIDPGPDMVFCDEGHILKNDATALAKAMNRITTRKRVVLTGTPLQNNLSEYHCMVHFVKPNLLGTRKEFQNRFMNPIVNGQLADSTPHDFRLMKRRAHILHNLLEGCVQRRDYNVLVPFLPPKHEYVISIRLSEVQIKLYRFFLDNFARGRMGNMKGSGLFADYQSLMKIWTHPYILKLAEIRDELKAQYNSDDSFIDDEETPESTSESESDVQCLDEPSSSKGRRGGKKKGSASDNSDVEVINNWQTRRRRGDPEEFIPEPPRDTASKEWWTEIISEDDAMKFELGGKLVMLFDILQECEAIGDKVLVFSQSLLSLDLIERMLINMDEFKGENAETDKGNDCSNTWVKGLDYFRMDGSTQADLRQRCTDIFNEEDNIRGRLFLISTRAGGLGINLVSANRVVIFDASWNPTHDVQSIFRVYRFGQKKPVYVYRFLAQGTMEEKIYDRQISKLSLACRVVDEQQIERHFNAADLQELYIFTPESTSSKATPMVPKDRLLAELLIRQKEWIAGYHEHDSLLENKESEHLTEEERRAAWAEYEAEKKGLVSAGLGVASLSGAMDINTIIEKIQEQWPGIGQEDLNQKVDQVLVWLKHQQQQQQYQAYQQRQQLYQQQQQQYYQQQQLLQQQQQQYAMMNQYRPQWSSQNNSYLPYPQPGAAQMPSTDNVDSSNDDVTITSPPPSNEPSTTK